MIGAAVAALLVFAGFATGYYFHAHKKPVPINTDRIAATEKSKPKYNHTTYEISPPSRGAVLKTLTVDLNPENSVASITLDSGIAADVKTGQTVLLYDANNALLNMLGKVIAVSADTEYEVNVTIQIDQGDIDAVTSITKADIILDRRTDAQRLPLTAVIYDVTKNSDPYVWEVNRNEDGTSSAYYKRTNVVLSTNDFVVIETPGSKSNVFVLKPDSALTDGQIINTSETLYSAPSLTQDQIVAANIESRYPAPIGPDPYTGPDFPTTCSMTDTGDIAPGAMSLPQ